MRRFLKGATYSILALAGVAVAYGFAAQHRRDARILAAHPPPGSFVDVGGHRLHYRLRGGGGLTFVLEAGAGDYSGSWGAFEDSLATMGRVFVYDRAGLGWSEEGPRPRTAQRIVAELHRALAGANVPGPYVLVGHSLGGALQTLYAVTYPEDVAGLLLIDPSHRDQVRKLPQPPAWQRLLGTELPRTAPVGLAGLLMKSSDPMRLRTSHLETYGAEMRAVPESVARWGDAPIALGDTPIYVLTAGDYSHWPGDTDAERRAAWETWRSLHEELARASSSSFRKHVVVERAGHYVHLDAPGAVTAAARELVGAVGAHARE